MKTELAFRLAVGAMAAALAIPALAQDDDGRFGWLTRWLPQHSNNIDPIRGNDARDSKDSTVLRNDVPHDRTTLVAAPRQNWQAASSVQTSRDVADPLHSTAAGEPQTALPVTAVGEGSGETPADQARSADMDATAQRDEPIVYETPEAASIYGSDVTVHNTDGVAAVRDSLDRNVYTGVEGAGGVDPSRIGADAEASVPR